MELKLINLTLNNIKFEGQGYATVPQEMSFSRTVYAKYHTFRRINVNVSMTQTKEVLCPQRISARDKNIKLTKNGLC